MLQVRKRVYVNEQGGSVAQQQVGSCTFVETCVKHDPCFLP